MRAPVGRRRRGPGWTAPARPSAGVRAALHVVRHRPVGVARDRGAERLVDDAGLGPRALARERLRRPGLSAAGPAGPAPRRCRAAVSRRCGRGCSTCRTCCRRRRSCACRPWIVRRRAPAPSRCPCPRCRGARTGSASCTCRSSASIATIELENRFCPARSEPSCDERAARVAEGPVDGAELGIDGRVDPRRRAAGAASVVAAPRCRCRARRAARTPEAPHDRAGRWRSARARRRGRRRACRRSSMPS